MSFERKHPKNEAAELELGQAQTVSEVAVAFAHEAIEDASVETDLARQWLAAMRDAEGETLPEKVNDTGMAADFIADSQIDAGASLPPGDTGDDMFTPGARRRRFEEAGLPGEAMPPDEKAKAKPKRPGK